jgi:hypothetical protein
MPRQALRVPGGWESQILRQSAHEDSKVASPTHQPPLPLGIIPGTHFCKGLSQPQGHCVARRIMSIKNFNDAIGNWTYDLPACSTVPQQTALPRAPNLTFNMQIIKIFINCKWVDTRWHWSFHILHMHGLWMLITLDLVWEGYMGSM